MWAALYPDPVQALDTVISADVDKPLLSPVATTAAGPKVAVAGILTFTDPVVPVDEAFFVVMTVPSKENATNSPDRKPDPATDTVVPGTTHWVAATRWGTPGALETAKVKLVDLGTEVRSDTSATPFCCTAPTSTRKVPPDDGTGSG